MARTDQEIVDQTEELAALLCTRFMGSKPDGVNFRDSMHPQLQQCWAVACEIQGLLTATDPENAVAELDGEEPSPIVKEMQQWEPRLTDKVSYSTDEKDDRRHYVVELYIPTPARDPEPFPVAAERWVQNLISKERTHGRT